MNERASAFRVHSVYVALLAALGICLLVGVQGAQARIAVGPNYQLGTDQLPGRGKDAVGLSVDPRNPKHVVEINADWETSQCEYNTSFNGGKTWRGGHFHVPAGFNVGLPCTVGHHLAAAIQAGIVFGSAQNVYATFVSAAPLPTGGEAAKSLFVVVSHDGGRTFGTAQLLAQGGPTQAVGPDYVLPTVGVDPARAGGPQKDIVYVAAASTSTTGVAPNVTAAADVVVSTSTDGGATFAPVVDVNAPSDNALEQSQPVVNRNGTVYVTWREQLPGSVPNSLSTTGYLVVSKSSDHGQTWTRQRIAEVQGYTYPGPFPSPPFTSPAGSSFACCSFPRMAIDPAHNDLYVVYGQGPPPVPQTGIGQIADHFINPASAVYLVRSTNGGATWSAPVKINHPAPLTYQVDQTRHPSVAVAPDGRVDIVWQDRRNWYHACTNTHVICQEARLGDTYYSYSTNHGATFSRNYRITERSTNNDVGYDYRFGTYWAYGPQSVSLGGNKLLIAWMDSRQGNFQTDSQDIYLSQVSVGAKGPIPVSSISVPANPTDMSVAFSRLAYPAGTEAVLASTFATRDITRVVIVNQNDVPGVLAAGVLARANLGTVLLTDGSGLTPAVSAEVSRLQPAGAYVVGSPASVSDSVINGLVTAGVPQAQITRLPGFNPQDTARLVAEAADRRTPAEVAIGYPAFNGAIIANPYSRTAGAAAVLAAARRIPILYATRDTLPAETTAALKELGITRTFVIGDTSVVGDAVMGQLPAAQRIGSRDVYATSSALVKPSLQRGVPDNVIYATDGKNPLETALLGAPVARIGGLELVASGTRKVVDRTVLGLVGGDATHLFMVGVH
ncbi:MAG TPA: cell wall-binding repeat-containing protein [Solirubrobacteraceae bacterium]|nr:cell wall-binding repeat-containing protein [Solirubrobacteraceae bacterium]